MYQAIGRLLGSTLYEDFMADYWGRECLLSKGEPARFGDLFSWSGLETLLGTQRFDFPRLRLVRKGKVIPAEGYMELKRDRRSNPYVAHVSAKISAEMSTGAMLHIAAVHDAWAPLAAFAAALEHDLGASVQVNLHAALARSRGFSTHWDGHDVFVVQVTGKKAWRLFGVTESAPLAVAPDQKGSAPQQHMKEVVLETGDMLYVPRGYWHSAEALDDVSLHLTFAVQYPNGIEFLQWLAEDLKTNVEFRRDISRFALTQNEGEKKYLDAIRQAIIATLTRDGLEKFLQAYESKLGVTNQVQLDGGDGNESERD